jgi:hypothetical protein
VSIDERAYAPRTQSAAQMYAERYCCLPMACCEIRRAPSSQLESKSYRKNSDD